MSPIDLQVAEVRRLKVVYQQAVEAAANARIAHDAAQDKVRMVSGAIRNAVSYLNEMVVVRDGLMEIDAKVSALIVRSREQDAA